MQRSWHDPQSDQVFKPFTTDTSILSSDFWSENWCHDFVTWPKSDQVFWPFTTRICILSSNFWSRNCHDRDMIKNCSGFLAIYYNDLHFELELLFPKLLRSWHDKKLTRFSGHLLQWSPFWARTFGPEVVTIVTCEPNRCSLTPPCHTVTVSPRHPSLACSETKRGATCPAGVF